MSTTEPTINDALAAVLIETRSLWRKIGVVKSENVHVLKNVARQPDILINEPNVCPVIVETEVLPAVSVESDARKRLGEKLSPSGLRILSSLAIRLPSRLRDVSGQQLKDEILNACDFEMALFTGESPDSCERWPRQGWLKGNVTDLSVLVQSASVPPAVIEEAANKLVEGVSAAAALLTDMATAHPGAMDKICQELRQPDGEQTRRMAATILANALVFHESLSRGNGNLYEVRTLDELRLLRGGVSKNEVLEDWKRILKVNYWPIFDIAKRILDVIPIQTAKPLLEELVTTAGELVANHMMRSHDLTGAVFQRLIADRKFLAAYYTHPASAALLVGLAIDPDTTPANGSWSKGTDVTALKVADFACGTGTLLSAAYRRISQLHEAHGGDAELIHPDMMANALIGCDVLPAAAHLTASMLAGAHPRVTYKGSSIMAVGLGPRAGGGFALGSLDLMDLQRPFDMVAVTAKALEGAGERELEVWQVLNHWTIDLVVMNPPFTRDTKGQTGGREQPNPMFAAFWLHPGTTKGDGSRIRTFVKEYSCSRECGRGQRFSGPSRPQIDNGRNAGNGHATKFDIRRSLGRFEAIAERSYSDLVLVSIAGGGHDDMSFSADTGMGECLVIGHKATIENNRATFVVLTERPASTIIGSSIAEQIRKLRDGNLRKLEDGPVGGSQFYFGDDPIGYAIDAPLPEKGQWSLARIKDITLAQTAYQMANCGLCWMPSMVRNAAIPICVVKLSGFGKVGPYHLDINANTANGGIRGPFRVEKITVKSAPTYPILWAHDAKRERCMQFEADGEAIIRQGKDSAEENMVRSKADRIWATASHCHFNTDFQFNSQSTPMQFTSKKTIGGNAWPSISLLNAEQEKAFVLWANSSLGLLLHWWHANKQQAGRGRIGVSALASLPVLDVTKLSEEQLKRAVAIFDDMKHKELRPIHEINIDTVRHEIDRRLAVEVLGFPAELAAPDGPLALLRQKLALEPSINGGKKSH